MELMIVVVIIGVLTAIALPSYRIQVNKMKNQEAIRVLMVLWEAQKEYYKENGSYLAGDIDDINADLGVEIPQPKNFWNVQVFNAAPTTCTAGPQILLASMIAIGGGAGGYALSVLEDGRVTCAPLIGPCPGSLCTKMGFPDW